MSDQSIGETMQAVAAPIVTALATIIALLTTIEKNTRPKK